MTMIAERNFDLKQFVFYNNENPLVKLYQSNDNKYTQVRYLKKEVDDSEEDPEYYAPYRSITLNDNAQIIGYGIPKSMDYKLFCDTFDNVHMQDL